MERIKKCPYCSEEILVAAKKCRYCHEWLDDIDNDDIGNVIDIDDKVIVEEEPVTVDKKRQSNLAGKLGFVFALAGTLLYWATVILSLGPIIASVGLICAFTGLIMAFVGIFKKPRGFAIAGVVISFIYFLSIILLVLLQEKDIDRYNTIMRTIKVTRSSSINDNSPSSVVKKAYTALFEKDLDTFFKYCYDIPREVKDALHGFVDNSDLSNVKLEILNERIFDNGEKAEVIVNVTFNEHEDTNNVTLMKTNSGWKIYADADADAKSKPQSAPSSAISITAARLWREYEANELNSDTKYKGKILSVTGRVNSVEKGNRGDSYYLLIDAEDSVYDITVYFKTSEISKLGNLSKGQRITIIGTCVGKCRFRSLCIRDSIIKN